MQKSFNYKVSNRLILWLLSFLLVACSSAEVKLTPTTQPSPTTSVSTAPLPTPVISTPTHAPTNVSQDWERRWLRHIPCEAPCFEGITPGKTSLKEAINALGSNPLVTNVEVDPPPKILFWDWTAYRDNSVSSKTPSVAAHNRGGSAAATYNATDNQIITTISPSFLASFTLKEIIDSYGQPSHILANARPDYDHINENSLFDIVILYSEKGLGITTYRPLTKRPTLAADLVLGDVFFFIPGQQNNLGINISKIVSWQGYKDFEFYCLLTEPTNNRCKDTR